MAAPGKKGKKTKGKTLALNEFLANKTDEPEPVKPWKASWADEDVDEDFSYRSKDKHVVLPTAPRATREPGVIDESRIPNEAPFIAYISNLPYDVDNEDITDFFKGLEIKGLRLPRDEGREGSKLKGFGYVEFEDRDSLKEALHFANRDIKGRSVGVEVAEGGDDRYRRGGMGRDMMRRGAGMGRDIDGPDRTLGDWRSGPRDEDREPERERGGGFGYRDRGSGGRRDFGVGFRDRDGGGGFRERDGGGGGGFSERWGSDRDFGRREGGERDFVRREGGDRDFVRREGGDRDFVRREGGDRDFVRREGSDRDFVRREGGDRDPGQRRETGFTRRAFDEKEEAPEREFGRARPKLQLTPRTKAPEEKKADVAPVVAQSSIFGGAKPVDTAAREREIEERLARERGSAEPASATSSTVGSSSSGGRDADQSRPRSIGEEAEEENKPRKENVWTKRSQRPVDDHHPQDGGHSEVTREKNEQESEYEYAKTATITDSLETGRDGPIQKNVVDGSYGKDKHEPLTKARPQAATVGHDNIRMPEFIEEGPPNFAITNKFASLPDEDAAETSE